MISRQKKNEQENTKFSFSYTDSRLWRAETIYRFDVAVQEANRVDALNSLQYLPAKSERGADSERPTVCTSPQIRQITTLKW